VAAITLALGIGANTTMFSVVNSVLLRPLPYPQPNRLVHFELRMDGGTNDALSVPQFQFFRDHSNAFEDVAADRGGADVELKQGNTVQWMSSYQVTDDFFRTLGVHPAMGREFVREETLPTGSPVAILTEAIWRAVFHADSNILGRQIEIDDHGYTIVGVLPRGFRFVDGSPDIFTALHLGNTLSDRGMNTEVLGRLRENENLRAAQADMHVVYDQFHRQDSVRQGDRGVQLIGYQDFLVGDIKPSLLMLFGAVGLLLLVACANVASLLLARSSVRQKEISIRLALGARRLRLLQQFLTEGLLIAFIGGTAGLLTATWGLTILVGSIPFYLPSSVTMKVDARVLAFTFFIAVATSIAFGLASFWQTSKLDLNSSLKESAKGSESVSHNFTGGVLVVGEVALSVALLIGAGLLIKSLYHLRQQNLGFDPQNVFMMSTLFRPPKGAPREAVWNSQQEILRRIQALPGVVSAAVVTVPPFVGRSNLPTQREGHPEQGIGGMEIRTISQDYFRTMSIPILQGRSFSDTDNAGSEPTVAISENLARRWWNGASPVGDHLIIGMLGGKLYTPAADVREIVGVVGNVKGRSMQAAAPPMIYIPLSQAAADSTIPPSSWVIRTQKNVNIAAALRTVVTQINPEQRIDLFGPMQHFVDISVAGPNFDAQLMALFAALALALTAVGIYGALSFHVARRTHEIGIRMALGATRRDVLRLVVGRGMILVWMGIGIGIAAALGLTRLLRALLFQVQPSDFVTYAAVAVVLTCVAFFASYIPARRAMKVDPMVALRYE
ncbi:MAG: ABC transporter permease, partial [Candidatus Acidiferrales bacterium]